MAVTRTWKGGGNNQASNPNDWGPTGAPQPGDTLMVLSSSGTPPTSPVNSTMNVSGNALAGDPITIGLPGFGTVNLTANLSHNALMTATEYGGRGTYNMVQNSTLNLLERGGVHVGPASATINMLGNENLILSNISSAITVNLAPGADWHGSLRAQALEIFSGATTVKGGAGSSFDNNGLSYLLNGKSARIDTDVVGFGQFFVTNNGQSYSPPTLPKLEFVHAVAAGQAVVNSGLVVIDHPNQFKAGIALTTSELPGAPLPAEIDLMGLAAADSYSYKTDMLSIYHGNSVIDTLRFNDTTAHGFAVEKVGGSVHIVAIVDPTHPPVSLPLHG